MTTGVTMPGSRWRRVGHAQVPAAVLAVLADAGGWVVVGGAGGVARRWPDGTWAAADAGVGAVAALTRSGATLLAGGADGIAWSADDGASWRRAKLHGVPAPVTALAAAGRVVLAGTLGGGVLRSADAGRTWAPAGFGLASHDVSTLIFTADGETVISGTDAGIHVSPNSGRAWRQAADTAGVRVTALAVLSGPAVWAVGESGEVLASTDAGRTWTRPGSLPAGALPSSLAVDGDVLLAATASGVLHSADGGATWHVVHGEPAFALVRGGDGALVAGTDAGLVTSSDDGWTWSPAGAVPPVHDLARLVVTGSEVLAYGPMSGVVRCRSGEPVGGAPYPVAVLAAGPDDVLLAAGPDGLARSADAGRSWTTVLPGDAGFVHVLAPAEHRSWWAATRDGARVLGSVDGGRTWKSHPSPWGTATVLALAARGDAVLAATYDTAGAAVDLWRRRVDGPWSHAGRVPTPGPSVHLTLHPPAAAFGGRWMYGRNGGWRPGEGPEGRLRRLAGSGDRLVALTDAQLAESVDRGGSWAPIGGIDPADAVDVAIAGAATLVLRRSGELWTTG